MSFGEDIQSKHSSSVPLKCAKNVIPNGSFIVLFYNFYITFVFLQRLILNGYGKGLNERKQSNNQETQTMGLSV
jgi:hypothetical protein